VVKEIGVISEDDHEVDSPNPVVKKHPLKSIDLDKYETLSPKVQHTHLQMEHTGEQPSQT
jgi:hypothetical protein